jgi:hypothetical protein
MIIILLALQIDGFIHGQISPPATANSGERLPEQQIIIAFPTSPPPSPRHSASSGKIAIPRIFLQLSCRPRP